MGWVDRINRRVLDAVAARRGRDAAALRSAVPLSPALIPRLRRLDLISHDEFIGETLMLCGLLDDGSATVITEAAPQWAAVGEALTRSGRLAVSLDVAALHLLADRERQPVHLLAQTAPSP